MRYAAPAARSGAALAALTCLALTLTGPQNASALTLEELQGVKIEVRMSYNTRIRRAEGEFPSTLHTVWRLTIGPEAKIAGSISRTVSTPRGPRSTSRQMNGIIGQPRELASGSGHALWILDGEKLTLLRTFETGGLKAEITINGSSCSVRAPLVREEGAGNLRRTDSVVGGPVEVLSMTQTSASCRISR